MSLCLCRDFRDTLYKYLGFNNKLFQTILRVSGFDLKDKINIISSTAKIATIKPSNNNYYWNFQLPWGGIRNKGKAREANRTPLDIYLMAAKNGMESINNSETSCVSSSLASPPPSPIPSQGCRFSFLSTPTPPQPRNTNTRTHLFRLIL